MTIWPKRPTATFQKVNGLCVFGTLSVLHIVWWVRSQKGHVFTLLLQSSLKGLVFAYWPSAISVDCIWRWNLIWVQGVNEEFVRTNDDMNNEEIESKAKQNRSRKIAGGLSSAILYKAWQRSKRCPKRTCYHLQWTSERHQNRIPWKRVRVLRTTR